MLLLIAQLLRTNLVEFAIPIGLLDEKELVEWKLFVNICFELRVANCVRTFLFDVEWQTPNCSFIVCTFFLILIFVCWFVFVVHFARRCDIGACAGTFVSRAVWSERLRSLTVCFFLIGQREFYLFFLFVVFSCEQRIDTSVVEFFMVGFIVHV